MDMAMHNSAVLTLLLQLVTALSSLLILLIAWIGVKVHSRLDQISQSLVNIDKEIGKEINHLGTRVTRLESFHLGKSNSIRD